MLAVFGLGHWELIIVLVILLLLFGRRLPEVMRSMGRGAKEFKKGLQDDLDEDAEATKGPKDDTDDKDEGASGQAG
ncbi:MAG: twin-arginine translocase TatA/TatE family subunit [Candidatus Brocadiia bacterium]|jgi:sec-independent protein translocase protein TatA|nr:twin-arginine translocase TatA/TatE family subunit [Candidatus Brocadiia bacterium]